MGNAPTKEEVKEAYKTWVLQLHPNKNRDNAAKATKLFKGLNASDKARKKAERRRQGRGRPQFSFNHTYFESNFCGPGGMHGGARSHRGGRNKIKE